MIWRCRRVHSQIEQKRGRWLSSWRNLSVSSQRQGFTSCYPQGSILHKKIWQCLYRPCARLRTYRQGDKVRTLKRLELGRQESQAARRCAVVFQTLLHTLQAREFSKAPLVSWSFGDGTPVIRSQSQVLWIKSMKPRSILPGSQSYRWCQKWWGLKQRSKRFSHSIDGTCRLLLHQLCSIRKSHIFSKIMQSFPKCTSPKLRR